MKKLLFLAMTGIVFLSVCAPLAYAQKDEKVLFKKEPQADAIASSDQYVIGPEDVLYINVWREETLTRTILVRADGRISLPLIDDVQAAGLTPLQLKQILTEKLKTFIDSPNVSVVVTEANSFKVFVTGEVRTPGVYRLRSETTLLQIIPMAGGFTDWANQKKILIVRREGGKEKRITANYKKILEGEELSSNVVLKPGDTVIVP
jgi:polysaccharide biosynthesis/export protein